VSEKVFIRDSIKRGIPYLGVCLGAQLAADVLGGRVTRNLQKEIGWFPVHLTAQADNSPLFRAFPLQFLPFHWHGDTFSIPPGAIRMAYSDACANQAFQYGSHVIGLQFHLDYSVQGIRRMIRHCGDELVEQPTCQTHEAILVCPERVKHACQLLYRLLDTMQAEVFCNSAATAAGASQPGAVSHE
jgi:GMP synthase-like glutamine amidotransferase